MPQVIVLYDDSKFSKEQLMHISDNLGAITAEFLSVDGIELSRNDISLTMLPYGYFDKHQNDIEFYIYFTPTNSRVAYVENLTLEMTKRIRLLLDEGITYYVWTRCPEGEFLSYKDIK